MKEFLRKLFAILMITLMILGMVRFDALAAPEDDAAALAEQINAYHIPNLTASATGTAVNVRTLAVSVNASSAVALNIPTGVTVNWNAVYIGSVNDYLISVNGGGTLSINASIRNAGARTGGVIKATGSATINVNSGAELSAVNTGNPLLIDAGGVTVNINSGGTVRSVSSNSNAAIQINNNLQPVRINVTGGTVISELSGYAINDGAGTGTANNKTEIVVSNNGIVSSGSACAIRSAGTESVVTVNSGVVSNNAASNANPTIYMNGGTVKNVIVSGGTVQNIAADSTSYAIQTTGDIDVTSGGVFTINGRAINLVGVNSNATVSGDGTVQATGTGTAICTATTASVNVNETAVTISGGTVSATTGFAIRITGDNSKVNISGGTVSATTGNAVQVDSSAANAGISVSGGKVSATGAGNAIYITGTSTTTGITVSGGQITAQKGLAVRSAGTVTVTGGFLFAYGNGMSRSDVISATNIIPANFVNSLAMVCSWNADKGVVAYPEGSSLPENDLTRWSSSGSYQWHYHPTLGGGINYVNGTNTGFFPIAAVTIFRNSGLIFNTSTGDLYFTVTNMFGSTDQPAPGKGTAWAAEQVGSGYRLVIKGFSWVTNTEEALTIIGDAPVLIVLEGNGWFETMNVKGTGIKSNGRNITISGSGELTAKGSVSPDGIGLDIGAGSLTINSGTLVAQGGKRAIHWEGADTATTPKSGTGPTGSVYYRWKWSKNYDGSGTVKGSSIPEGSATPGDWDEDFNSAVEFEYFNTDHYVMLQTLVPLNLISAWQIGGVSGVSNSTGIVLTFDREVKDLTIDDIDISGAAVKGVAFTGSGRIWTVMLDSVSIDKGTAFVTVDHFGGYYLVQYAQDVEVYKANEHVNPVYPLTIAVTPQLGGSTSMGSFFSTDPQTQVFLAGTYIEVVAVANPGYKFVNWTISLGDLESEYTDTVATLYMPDHAVTLTANFTQVSSEPGTDLEPGDVPLSGDVSHMLDTEEHVEYVHGVGNNLFEPNRSISRAEVAQLFFNLLLDKDVEIAAQFPDVPAVAWFYEPIHTLAAINVVYGYPDGGYHPNDDITRAEFVAIVVRFVKEMPEPAEDAPFPDIQNHWAYGVIDAAAQFKWVTGYPDGTFQPNRPITRAEAVTIVNRVLVRVADREYIDANPEINYFTDVVKTHWAYYDILEAAIVHDYIRPDGVEKWNP